MKTRTSELTDAALDWAVAKAEYTDGRIVRAERSWRGDSSIVFVGTAPGAEQVFRFMPSTQWSQGGPISERERIEVGWTSEDIEGNPAGWYASMYWRGTDCLPAAAAGESLRATGDGPTELIAKMRCFVASRLGLEVDVPEELTK